MIWLAWLAVIIIVAADILVSASVYAIDVVIRAMPARLRSRLRKSARRGLTRTRDRENPPPSTSESNANPTFSPGLLIADDTASTAANKRFNIDKLNCRLVDPAIALTRIGADIETGGATP
jgi:hypothetical protein